MAAESYSRLLAEVQAIEIDQFDLGPAIRKATEVIGETGSRDDDPFDFIGTDAFTALGQARFFQDGVNTYIEVNVSGTNAADMRIRLQGPMTLDAEDFVL